MTQEEHAPRTQAGAEVPLRKAVAGDMIRIQRLINPFADRKLMLPRALGELYETVRDFHVIATDDELIGCVSLHPVWDELAEVKCLAVGEAHQGRGLGGTLVEAAIAEARTMGFRRLFTLTYRASFFQRLGFRPIDKQELPHRVWIECTRCPLFPDCNEESLSLDLVSPDADATV